MKPLRWSIPVLLALLCALSSSGQTLPAQSDHELRRQNEALTAENQQLQEQLDQLKRENHAMQERIAALEQALSNARRGGAARPTTQPEAEPEKVTIDETVPLNSPRALHKAVAASLEAAMTGQDPGKPGDTKRRAYIRKLEDWRADAERQHRGPIVWHVRVVDDRPGPRSSERTLTLRPVDPETDARLGDNFDVVLSRTLWGRLAHDSQDGELGVLVLRGNLATQININERRTERGSFDNPPFLGMFTEFGYVIDVKSLLTLEDDKARSAGATTRPAERTSNPR